MTDDGEGERGSPAPDDDGADGEDGRPVRDVLDAIQADTAAVRRMVATLARNQRDIVAALRDGDAVDLADPLDVEDDDDAPGRVAVRLTGRELDAARAAGDSPGEWVRRSMALRADLANDGGILDNMTGAAGGRCPVCGQAAVRRVGDGDAETLQPCGHRVPADVHDGDGWTPPDDVDGLDVEDADDAADADE